MIAIICPVPGLTCFIRGGAVQSVRHRPFTLGIRLLFDNNAGATLPTTVAVGLAPLLQVELAALGWGTLDLAAEVTPGTALVVPDAVLVQMVVKPGSYPWPQAVERAWESCL